MDWQDKVIGSVLMGASAVLAVIILTAFALPIMSLIEGRDLVRLIVDPTQ